MLMGRTAAFTREKRIQRDGGGKSHRFVNRLVAAAPSRVYIAVCIVALHL